MGNEMDSRVCSQHAKGKGSVDGINDRASQKE